MFSVEPIAVYNEIFNEKAKKYKNITLYPYALGADEQNVELVTSSQSGVLNTGMPHIYNSQQDGKIENQDFIFNATMRKPSVLFANLDRIDYIKCDIEGFEYIVFSDMKEIVRRYRPKVQVEVWSDNEKNMLELFDELGYTPYKLYKNQLVLQDESNCSIPGDYIFLPNKI